MNIYKPRNMRGFVLLKFSLFDFQRKQDYTKQTYAMHGSAGLNAGRNSHAEQRAFAEKKSLRPHLLCVKTITLVCFSLSFSLCLAACFLPISSCILLLSPCIFFLVPCFSFSIISFSSSPPSVSFWHHPLTYVVPSLHLLQQAIVLV